ncbi:hypothetical protein [Paenibacillus naphthalenovorans]|uniref:Uncharacterized protein n=1 Tax=Paenibacillus naphthalenovorans TaxID=162209 RepID=A0A0U2M3W8_9BACL|nr:hypothetical protein [Paenibacillus naphthalenovorans]ALS22160.1 hypothetical protein IJ22_17860 [Paenibacillus naphthalenovorans]
MELIDKQKLQEIERIAGSNEFWALGSGEHLNMIDTLIDFVHSTQEEIAKESKLKHEAYNNLTRCHEQMSDFAEEIAKLRRQRDEAREGAEESQNDYINAKYKNDALEARAIQAEQERNALLEGMKKIAEFKKGEALVYVTEIKNIARSFIAKIEGK